MTTIEPVASFPDLSLAALSVSRGRHLPCWEAQGAIYHVTFHLADSVPQEQLEIWKAERARLSELARTAKRPLTADEVAQLKALYDEHVEAYLSAGYGACLLRDGSAATALSETLVHSNGSAYALHAWCIMPNHVHVIVGGFTEDRPMRTEVAAWKRISAHRINKALGREGDVWHQDMFTRIIRDREEYARQMSYVWNNPEVSGLTAGFRRERYTQG